VEDEQPSDPRPVIVKKVNPHTVHQDAAPGHADVISWNEAHDVQHAAVLLSHACTHKQWLKEFDGGS